MTVGFKGCEINYFEDSKFICDEDLITYYGWPIKKMSFYLPEKLEYVGCM